MNENHSGRPRPSQNEHSCRMMRSNQIAFDTPHKTNNYCIVALRNRITCSLAASVETLVSAQGKEPRMPNSRAQKLNKIGGKIPESSRSGLETGSSQGIGTSSSVSGTNLELSSQTRSISFSFYCIQKEITDFRGKPASGRGRLCFLPQRQGSCIRALSNKVKAFQASDKKKKMLHCSHTILYGTLKVMEKIRFGTHSWKTPAALNQGPSLKLSKACRTRTFSAETTKGP